jgi:hypothetical protein
MFVVPGQHPRTVAIAPQAGTEAPIGLIKKDSTNIKGREEKELFKIVHARGRDS